MNSTPTQVGNDNMQEASTSPPIRTSNPTSEAAILRTTCNILAQETLTLQANMRGQLRDIHAMKQEIEELEDLIGLLYFAPTIKEKFKKLLKITGKYKKSEAQVPAPVDAALS